MVIRLIYNFSGSRGTRDSFAGFNYSTNLTYLKLIICKFIYMKQFVFITLLILAVQAISNKPHIQFKNGEFTLIQV